MKLYEIPQDKANHILYGIAFFEIANFFVTTSISLLIVTVVAILAELYQKFFNKGNAEILDALSTIVGALILTLIEVLR